MFSFRTLPTITKNLIIINIIMFIASFTFESLGIDFIALFGLHYFSSELFYPHQLITYMFMHSKNGLSHIFFNMFGLFLFGKVLEQVWGSKKFLIYYIITGVGAGLTNLLVTHFRLSGFISLLAPEDYQMVKVQGYQLLMESKNYINPILAKVNILLNIPTVGASGSLYGILLAYGVLFPNSQIMLIFPPISLKAKWFVIIFGLIELFSGLADTAGDNVAHFAHLGGMLFGFILLMSWKNKSGSFY